MAQAARCYDPALSLWRALAQNNGCICCTVRIDLITILTKLARRKKDGGRLDHIIIETTGLADPAPVAQSKGGRGSNRRLWHPQPYPTPPDPPPGLR